MTPAMCAYSATYLLGRPPCARASTIRIGRARRARFAGFARGVRVFFFGIVPRCAVRGFSGATIATTVLGRYDAAVCLTTGSGMDEQRRGERRVTLSSRSKVSLGVLGAIAVALWPLHSWLATHLENHVMTTAQG